MVFGFHQDNNIHKKVNFEIIFATTPSSLTQMLALLQLAVALKDALWFAGEVLPFTGKPVSYL